MKITITGASDDLIEIDGDIAEEFNHHPEDDEDAFLAVSDGTLLRVTYDRDGIWRFTCMAHGSATMTKIEGNVEDDTPDKVTLEGDVRWIVLGRQLAKNG